MRLQQYISEIKLEKGFGKITPKGILKDCKPWFDYCNKQGVKNKFLWRGSSHNIKTYTKLKNRGGRNPKDTCKGVHNNADYFFYEIFNIRARSNSVFCFSSYKASRIYGKYQNIVIPIGKFSYIWSPKITDFFDHIELTEFYNNICNIEFGNYSFLFVYYENQYGKGSENGSWYYNNEDTKTQNKYDAIEVVKNWKLEDGEITEEELEENYELIFYKIKSKLIWKPDLEFEDYVQKKLSEAKKELKNFIKNNYIKNKRFKDLMDDTSYYKNEVMLQCNEYYNINKDWAKENLESII